MPASATVLVVEDDPVTRELLEGILQTGGFTVVAVPTGNTALLMLCQQFGQIDWLVTRINLPGLVDGWLLADEYHRHHAGRPVILLSEQLPEAECPSIDGLFVPPTALMRVLEVLKSLAWPEPVRAAPIGISRAA
jgi:CheY-like chemotaxis protein